MYAYVENHCNQTEKGYFTKTTLTYFSLGLFCTALFWPIVARMSRETALLKTRQNNRRNVLNTFSTTEAQMQTSSFRFACFLPNLFMLLFFIVLILIILLFSVNRHIIIQSDLDFRLYNQGLQFSE